VVARLVRARRRNFVGFCIWFGIIVAVLGGIGFGAYFAWNALGEKPPTSSRIRGKRTSPGRKGKGVSPRAGEPGRQAPEERCNGNGFSPGG